MNKTFQMSRADRASQPQDPKELSVFYEDLDSRIFSAKRLGVLCWICIFFIAPVNLKAQSSWVWTSETVDKSARFNSMAVDDQNNLHISYVDGDGNLNYGFRPAGSAKWFVLPLDTGVEAKEGYSNLKVDHNGNPHICFTVGVVKYAYWDGKEWHTQAIAPDRARISYSCSVGFKPDGTSPQVTWYRERDPDGTFFLHMKYASLVDGVWGIRTIDFDAQTGKWHSMVVDSQGVPHVSYDAFVKGLMKYATWNGTEWETRLVDFRGHTDKAPNLGMGSSLTLGTDGQALISYVDSESLKFARQKGETFSIETVDSVLHYEGWMADHTSLALDKQGFPHISYESAGTLKHAFWDGQKWHTQVIASHVSDPYRFSSIAVGPDNTLYILYRDPTDGSLKLATGHAKENLQQAAGEVKDKN